MSAARLLAELDVRIGVFRQPAMQTPVLVLNASYEPINICGARRALVLVLKGVARTEEEQGAVLHAARMAAGERERETLLLFGSGHALEHKDESTPGSADVDRFVRGVQDEHRGLHRGLTKYTGPHIRLRQHPPRALSARVPDVTFST